MSVRRTKQKEFQDKRSEQRYLAGQRAREAIVGQRRSSRATIQQTSSQLLAAGGERKYVDGYLDATSLHELSTNDDGWEDTELDPRQATATYGCMPVPKQGNGYFNRLGRKIIIKKIVIRGQIVWGGLLTPSQSADTSPIVRLVVYKDTKTNKAQSQGEEVLGVGFGSDDLAAKSADSQIMVLSKPSGWGRYQIMKDKMYTRPFADMAYNGTTDILPKCTTPFKFTLNLNTEVNFEGSTGAGAVTTIIDNSFHLIGASSDTSSTAPTISYVARTTFCG